MSNDNSIVRSLHDLGLGAWFGGSLMGAVGVNGAADEVREPHERLQTAAAGWARWAPVNAVAIGAHIVGAVGMLVANRDRVRRQPGVGSSSVVKTILTAGALAATAYAGVLGARTVQDGADPVEGSVEPGPGTSPATAQAQQRLQVVQWVIPALTGALTVVSAVQGEQQKPASQLGSTLRGAVARLT